MNTHKLLKWLEEGEIDDLPYVEPIRKRWKTQEPHEQEEGTYNKGWVRTIQED